MNFKNTFLKLCLFSSFMFDLALAYAISQTPETIFAAFLSSNSKTAQIYKTAFAAGLIVGVKTPATDGCATLISQTSELPEIAMIQFYCALKLKAIDRIKSLLPTISASPKIWFYEDDYEREYLKLALGDNTRPADIVKIIGVSSSRPILNYNLIREALQQVKGARKTELAEIGVKLEKGSRLAHHLSSNGLLAAAT